jgi:Na+/H+ antiporter NhaD/arsenite permease-like protein
MTNVSALIVLTFCVLLAIAVCAPFIYLVRRLRKQSPDHKLKPHSKRATGYILGLLCVLVMYLANAQQYIDPNGYFGSRVGDTEGRFWLALLLLMVVTIANYAVTALILRLRNRTSYRAPRTDNQDDQEGSD